MDRPEHSEPDLDVTVVVSTFRRPQLLPRLVRALEQQDLPRDRFEIVVVDNASPDETSEVLVALQRVTTHQLRVARARVNRGPASGRNLGVELARGPVVAFTDDDCVPDPGWLRGGLRAMGEGRRLVVGRTVPPADHPVGPFARVLRVDDARYMQTCNVFYRRSDLEELGGFDERIGFGEDTDLGLRALESGVEVVFAPEALVVHDVRPRTVAEAVRGAAAWSDLPRVVRRHPHLRGTHLHRRVFWKRSHPPALLAAAGMVLTFRRPLVGLALISPYLRFRLVDQPLAAGRRERLLTLPGALAVDLAEVAAMVRGSIRHRTVVL